MAGARTQQHQDAIHATHHSRGGWRFLAEGHGVDARQQHLRHFFHRQNVSGVTGLDGADRHAGIFRRGRILHQGDAAGTEDGAQTQRAIGAGAGQDDANGIFSLVIGQGAQEGVNRHA